MAIRAIFWILAPDSWILSYPRAALERAMARDPVFGLLAGLLTGA
jgi:hypothetical protein